VAIKKLSTATEQALAKIGKPILYWALGLIDSIDSNDMVAQTTGFDLKSYDNDIEELRLKAENYSSPENFTSKLYNDIEELRLKIESYPSPEDFDSKLERLEELVFSHAYEPKTSSPEPWPVGSIFISIVDTNPADLLGYGTWEVFGTGRMLIGVDPADPDFDTPEETGGAKTHDHPITTSTGPSATETVDNDGTGSTVAVASATHTHDVDLAEINHMPPYIAVYMWKRTA